MTGPIRTRSMALSALLLLVALSACSDDEGPDWSDPTRIDFDPSLGVDLAAMERRPSGLYIQELVVGDGPVVEANDRVEVAYTGWLPNGAAFDGRPLSSPIEFGLNEVIDGWQEGLVGMQPGGDRLLVIPPGLAYGNRPNGPIPANSTLVFRVVLVSIPGKN
jgi:FKBP-type peptidyl-prolyl cis-trans isomerase FkpA